MKTQSKNKNNNIGKKVVIAGVICIAAAITLFIYNKITDHNAGQYSHRVVEEIKDHISQNKGKVNDDHSDPISDKDHDAQINGSSVVHLEGYDYIGYLTIPSLGQELPVASTWNYDRLALTPCRYSGSLVTRDLVIAGHNYDSHFGMIKYLVKGSDVILTNLMGDSFYFEVVMIETLDPGETEKMIDSGYDLTLFTCNMMGTDRVTVRCSRKTPGTAQN